MHVGHRRHMLEHERHAGRTGELLTCFVLDRNAARPHLDGDTAFHVPESRILSLFILILSFYLTSWAFRRGDDIWKDISGPAEAGRGFEPLRYHVVLPAFAAPSCTRQQTDDQTCGFEPHDPCGPSPCSLAGICRSRPDEHRVSSGQFVKMSRRQDSGGLPALPLSYGPVTRARRDSNPRHGG